MEGPLIFFGLLLVGGSVFALVGWAMVRQMRKQAREWMSVVGEVTGFEERRGNKGGVLYAPIYRFQIGGAEGTGTSSVARRPAGYDIGDPVKLLVNPANLAESDVIDTTAKFLSWGTLTAGLLLLAVAAGWLWAILTGRVIG
jgi:hypothetical protein